MNLAEVTSLLAWVSENRIDAYVKIDALTDKILDLLEKNIVEPPAPILIGETN